MEQTLIIVKPDGVQRGLIGEIIGRIEKKGLKISALKLEKISKEKAEIHYAEHRDKSFYHDLISFLTSSPVVLAVVEGEGVIDVVHRMAGATSPLKSQFGSIRGDFAISTTKNVIHTSDSVESATREIENFFNRDEVIQYELITKEWL